LHRRVVYKKVRGLHAYGFFMAGKINSLRDAR